MFNEPGLLGCYRKEKIRYLKILELANSLRDALKDGRTMPEIISILNRKNMIMKEIESIEQSMEEEKKDYRWSGKKTGDVAQIIDQLSVIVERILAVERENEILFSTAGQSLNLNRRQDISPDFVLSVYANSITGERR